MPATRPTTIPTWGVAMLVVLLGVEVVGQEQGASESARFKAGGFGKEVVEAIRRHDLLVAVAFGEGRSALDERHLFLKELREVIHETQKVLREKESPRLQWAVFSYGERPTVRLEPTVDADAAMKAAEELTTEGPGARDTIGAIEFVMATCASLRKPMFVAIVTDREGAEGKGAGDMEAALRRMREANVRVFVFGREACFQCPDVRDMLYGKDGKRGATFAYVQRGLDTCGYEFFPPDWFWVGQRTYNGVPSGFGPWFLSVLAQESGGRFHVLRDEAERYDGDRMRQYEPEWVGRKAYEERTQASPLRWRMAKLYEDYVATRPTCWLTDMDLIQVQTEAENEKARQLLVLVRDAIRDLEALKPASRSEKHAPKRWQANYDLALAVLYRLEFQAAEYIHVTQKALTDGFPLPRPGQKANLYSVSLDEAAAHAGSGADGDRRMAKAREMLTRVAEEYRGTPWGDVAAQELKRTVPLKMEAAFFIAPDGRRQ